MVVARQSGSIGTESTVLRSRAEQVRVKVKISLFPLCDAPRPQLVSAL